MSKEAKTGNWFQRHKVLSVIGILIVIGIIASAAGGSKSTKTSQPAAPDKTTATTTKAAPVAAQPQTLLDLSGSGTKQTQTFTVAGDWDLNYTYDCTQFAGGSGNFIATVYNKDGSISYSNTPVNQLGASGSDVQHYHKAGTYYLDINSECSWTVNVKG